MKAYYFKLKVIIYLLAFCTLSSCFQNTKIQDDLGHVIKVEIENKQIDKSISIKEVIPLETTSDCLIGEVTKAFYWNNQIIILDHWITKEVIVFNEKGKKIFKIIKGKGPGELLEPWAISINKKDSTILLYDRLYRSINEYDINWNLVETKTIQNHFIKDFFFLGIDKFLVFHQISINISKNETRNTTYSLISKDFSEVKHLDILLNPNKISHYLLSPVAISNKEILFVTPWNYNIYELLGEKYRIKYTLDFGDKGLSTDQLENLSTYELFPIVIEEEKVGCVSSIFKNNKILIFIADYGNFGHTFIYSFKDQKTYNLNNYIENRLLPKCVIWGIKEDGCIYALVEPNDFIKFNELSQNYNHLNIDNNSNPILISFQIEDL